MVAALGTTSEHPRMELAETRWRRGHLHLRTGNGDHGSELSRPGSRHHFLEPHLHALIAGKNSILTSGGSTLPLSYSWASIP